MNQSVNYERTWRIPYLFAAAVALPAAAAVIAGAPAWLTGAPLLLLGLALVYWNTHAALCFIAFSIMPFCVVQREVMGVTFNLPEVLILALAAKEGLRQLARREWFAPQLPLLPLAVLAAALAAALGTGLLRHNGAMAALQDCRQFSEFLVLFWLVVQSVRRREEAHAIALCFVAGAAFIALHGIVQQFTFAGISETQIASDFVLHKGVRSGSFYGATALGGMMVLACGPALGVLLASRRRGVRALVVLCIVLCLFALVFTKTRGSWLGLVVALGVIAAAVRPTRRQLLAAGVVAGVLALLLGAPIVSRIATLADPARDQSLMDRAQYYAAAYHIGRAHPILGLGWGCYYDIDEILKNEGYVRVPRPDAAALALLDETERDAAVREATVHSAYLQLFVKAGGLGVAGFFAVVLAWLERAWRARNARRDKDPGWALYAGVTAGLAGYLFHSTFENFFQWPVMAQSFWLLMGLSFALAPGADRPARYRAPAAALGAGAALFALFMYVCVQLETLHTDNYEQNVARALAEGDMEKALLVARRATEVELYDPMPKAVYARVLLAAGQPEAALAQLRMSAGEIHKEGAPPNQGTGAAYYFAPARLTLGKYYHEQGDWVRAVEQFELARAYDDLTGDDYAAFHPMLHAAYARRGRWARALEFGAPEAETISEMPGGALAQVAEVLAGRGQWDALAGFADAMEARGDLAADAMYFRGRALLGGAEYAAAVESLARADAADRANAAYFLGGALAAAGRSDEAVAAFHRVPADTVLYPMALARAAALTKDDTARTAILARMEQAIASMTPVRAGDTAGAPALVAYARNAADIAAAGPIPLLLRWENTSAAAGATPSVAADDGGGAVARIGGGRVLQLAWIENRVNWESVARVYPGDTALPGWIDAARDWFHLREEPGYTVARDEQGEAVLALSQRSWMFAAPVRVRSGSAFLTVGRLRDPGDNAAFGWQLVDTENNVLAGAEASAGAGPDGWAPRADYIVPEKGADALRLSFETVGPVRAPAQLGDVAVYLIAPPE